MKKEGLQLFLFFVLWCFPLLLAGQEKMQAPCEVINIWRKTGSITANLNDMAPAGDRKNSGTTFILGKIKDSALLQNRTYNLLFEALLYNAGFRTLPVYKDSTLARQLYDIDINEMLNPTMSFYEVLDPVSDELRFQLVYDFDLANRVHKYRIAQVSDFDFSTGHSTIHNIALTPVIEINGPASYYSSPDAFLWANYVAAARVIHQYETQHPDINFLQSQCNSLAGKAIFKSATDTMAHASRLICLMDSGVTGTKNDSILYASLMANVLSGKLIAYTDTLLTLPLTKKQLNTLPEAKDVVLYRILEDWTIDKQTDYIHVQVAGVAPVAEGRPLFWIKFKDFNNAVDAYQQEHYAVNLGYNLWRAYFLQEPSVKGSLSTTYAMQYVNLGDGIPVADSNRKCHTYDMGVYITDTTPINTQFAVNECYDGLTKAFIINACTSKLDIYENNVSGGSSIIRDRDILSEKLNPLISIGWKDDPVKGGGPHPLLYNYNLVNTIRKYEVKEKLVFDYKSGRTQVIPMSIAPIAEQYDEDGRKWPYSPFLTYYHSALSTIAEYEGLHPNVNFLQSLGNTLTNKSVFTPLADTLSVITRRVSRSFALNDTSVSDRQNDSLMYSLILENALSGALPVYADILLTKRMSNKELKRKSPFGMDARYGVLEDWTVDKLEDKLTVQVIALAMLANAKVLFWMKYGDIKQIADAYREGYYVPDIDAGLWRAYLGNK